MSLSILGVVEKARLKLVSKLAPVPTVSTTVMLDSIELGLNQSAEFSEYDLELLYSGITFNFFATSSIIPEGQELPISFLGGEISNYELINSVIESHFLTPLLSDSTHIELSDNLLISDNKDKQTVIELCYIPEIENLKDLFDTVELHYIKLCRNPQINTIENLELPPPEMEKCDISIDIIRSKLKMLDAKPQVENLNEFFIEGLEIPEIVSISLNLGQPQKAGKNYRNEVVEESLFKVACRHGRNPKDCKVCSPQIKKDQQQNKAVINVFDLLLPILQPPLTASLDSPVDFPHPLYDFQREGIKFLIEHEKALLGDEMGLGKSIQAITAARLLVRQGNVKKILILCPKAVLTDWDKKWWDWAPEIQVIKVAGNPNQRNINWKSPAHVYLVTYETMKQDLKSIVDTYFDLVILDEIQKIKNSSSQISSSTRKIKAQRRWGLSGTPLENRIDDLLSIFTYLVPGLLSSNLIYDPSTVQIAIKPYLLRRTKADSLKDLPAKVHETVWLDLTDKQRIAYDRAEQNGILELSKKGEKVTVQHIFALIQSLKQICNIDSVSGTSCKLDYLNEQLEQIDEQGDKALVFSQYPNVTLKKIEPRLKKYKPLIYDGSLSSPKQNQMVEKFNKEEDNRVLLMSLKSGGVGITLTRANYVFHYDLWWNPAIAAQAEDRAHRIGQKKTVFVTYLYTRDTIEERIHNIVEAKMRLFREIFDDITDTNLSTSLSEEELFSLFDLHKKRPIKPTEKKSKTPKTIEYIMSLNPTEFENLVAELYSNMGYNVKLTPPTRDNGVDVLAQRQTETGRDYLAIQCKHYKTGPVGVEPARALYGVINSEPSITKGILICSGEFSSDCKSFVRNKRIELVNGSVLLGLIKRYWDN
ncbi:MAG: SNF2-related protein [Syntrophomonas sp.]|uniref:SNF2-related protein n=1 Tax=Syntrophomonas sp. TaxID=2053627 RepID=UPI00262DBB11|nr:SNF2-related protein [Syntrophomonas sp.]MDD2509905.1 SNF2-related protein [Syntrophomonas sp.]MDD3878686.1 SNF2-related protein [Syntrophomonas sp.]MDD4626717.1 SNF2-related protein [Syntrophomonas sp.]